jgi:hypothetical protein
MIVGDINLDMFKLSYKDDTRYKKMKSILKKYQLYILSTNKCPTFRGYTGHSSHIDVIITNNLDLINSHNKEATVMDFVPWNTSTHTPVSIEVSIEKAVKYKIKKTVLKKTYTTWNTLVKRQYDYHILKSKHEANYTSGKVSQESCTKMITKTLKDAAKNAACVKTKRIICGTKKKIWDKNILDAVKKSKEIYRQLNVAKETGNATEIEELSVMDKQSKKNVRKAQRQASAKVKRKMLVDISDAALSDNKKFNRLIRNNKTAADITPILIDEKLIYDENESAKEWAKYHKDLATPKTLPHMDDEHLEYVKKTVAGIREILKHDTTRITVTPNDIKTAINKLNDGKAPDDDNLYAEHFKKSDEIIEMLMELYRLITESEQVSEFLKTSLKFSLPKKGKEHHLQVNYRGIAICKIILKIFEHIIHVKSNLEEDTDDLQFGFTRKRGPDMAALCLSEAIYEAADLNIGLTIVSLDTMKAFDMVHHDVLLYKLFFRGICPSIWKIIDSLLCNQKEKAVWGSAVSEFYEILQGTGQGKVLGAPLFKVFMEDTLKQLRSLDVGFHIGNVNVGNPTCADDLLLIATSPQKVQAMCDTVQYMSSVDRSTQQPTKSRLAFTKKTDANILMNGKKIPKEDHFIHVGVQRYQNSNNNLISDRISTMRKTSYGLMPSGIHGKNGLSPFYIRKILISHIIPRTNNGLHTIVLTKTQREHIDSAYSTLIKHLQSLRVNVSTVAAYLMIGMLPMSAEIDKRVLGLFGQICRMPESDTLKKLARRQLATKGLDSNSWFIYAYKMGKKYGIDIINALDLQWSKHQWKMHVKEAITSHVQYHFKREAYTMKSLKWLDIGMTSLRKCHSLWPCSSDSTDPILTTAASYRIKMLTLSYILQINVSKFEKSQASAQCPLCSEEDEDVQHFICTCKSLKKARKQPMKYLFKLLQRHNIETPPNKTELTSLILNGTNNSTINNACSMICLKLHNARKALYYELFPEKKKRGKKKEVDPQNKCIKCTKEVKGDQKAINCDLCSFWQHIKCDKIMTGWKYNRIVKGTETYTWVCKKCIHKMIEMTDQRIKENSQK